MGELGLAKRGLRKQMHEGVRDSWKRPARRGARCWAVTCASCEEEHQGCGDHGLEDTCLGSREGCGVGMSQIPGGTWGLGETSAVEIALGLGLCVLADDRSQVEAEDQGRATARVP